MGRIPDTLRTAIAANIRAARQEQYPGRGGSKRCAQAFSDFIGKTVTPQQWSPWERGRYTPDEFRLRQIADFFGVDVEDLRRPSPAAATKPHNPEPAVLWRLSKNYVGQSADGRCLRLSVTLVLSEERE